MKTSTLPPLRVEPRLRRDAQKLLREGETLSSFIVDAVEERIRNRAMEEEFIRRGLASAEEARLTGEYISASEVVAGLRRSLAGAMKRKGATRNRRRTVQRKR